MTNNSLCESFYDRVWAIIQSRMPDDAGFNLIEAFWLLRLDYGHFFAHIHQYHPETRENVLRKSLSDMRTKVCERYLPPLEGGWIPLLRDLASLIYDCFGGRQAPTSKQDNDDAPNSNLIKGIYQAISCVQAIDRTLYMADDSLYQPGILIADSVLMPFITGLYFKQFPQQEISRFSEMPLEIFLVNLAYYAEKQQYPCLPLPFHEQMAARQIIRKVSEVIQSKHSACDQSWVDFVSGQMTSIIIQSLEPVKKGRLFREAIRLKETMQSLRGNQPSIKNLKIYQGADTIPNGILLLNHIYRYALLVAARSDRQKRIERQKKVSPEEAKVLAMQQEKDFIGGLKKKMASERAAKFLKQTVDKVISDHHPKLSLDNIEEIALYLAGAEENPFLAVQPYSSSKRGKTHLNDEVFVNVKKKAGKLAEAIQRLHNAVDALFRYDVEEIRETRAKVLDQGKDKGNRKYSNICALLDRLEYPSPRSFNLELVLLFLFLENKPDLPGVVQIIIARYEAFFQTIYQELKQQDPVATGNLLDWERETVPGEMVAQYYRVPEYEPSPNANLRFFKLKKLLALYRFYCTAKGKGLSDSESSLLQGFERVLQETRLPYLAYDPIADGFLMYIKRTFGLTDSDIAERCGLTPSTFSRQQAKGKLNQRQLWFWASVTGFTYTYMNGETTIPNYGVLNPDGKAAYCFAPAIGMAYAEIILQDLGRLLAYHNELNSNDTKRNSKRNSGRIHFITPSHLKEMSRATILLANRLQRCRFTLDDLYRRKLDNERRDIEPDNHKPAFDAYYSSVMERFKIMDRLFQEEEFFLDPALQEVAKKALDIWAKQISDVISEAVRIYKESPNELPAFKKKFLSNS